MLGIAAYAANNTTMVTATIIEERDDSLRQWAFVFVDAVLCAIVTIYLNPNFILKKPIAVIFSNINPW